MPATRVWAGAPLVPGGYQDADAHDRRNLGSGCSARARGAETRVGRWQLPLLLRLPAAHSGLPGAGRGRSTPAPGLLRAIPVLSARGGLLRARRRLGSQAPPLPPPLQAPWPRPPRARPRLLPIAFPFDSLARWSGPGA